MLTTPSTAANSSRSLVSYRAAAAQANTVGPADLGIGGSAGGGGGNANNGGNGAVPGAGGNGGAGGNNPVGGGTTTGSASGSLPTAGAGMLAAPGMAGLLVAGVWALLL